MSQLSKEPTPDAVRQQLSKILLSRSFKHTRRGGLFLKFVVEQALAGKTPKQYDIATEGLGRRADFDADADSTVRTVARELRVALARYYGSEGLHDDVKIDIPRGSYVPAWSFASKLVSHEQSARSSEVAFGASEIRSTAQPVGDSGKHELKSTSVATTQHTRSKRIFIAGAVATALILPAKRLLNWYYSPRVTIFPSAFSIGSDAAVFVDVINRDDVPVATWVEIKIKSEKPWYSVVKHSSRKLLKTGLSREGGPILTTPPEYYAPVSKLTFLSDQKDNLKPDSLLWIMQDLGVTRLYWYVGRLVPDERISAKISSQGLEGGASVNLSLVQAGGQPLGERQLPLGLLTSFDVPPELNDMTVLSITELQSGITSTSEVQ